MATGFIYVVTSVTRQYQQEEFRNVPTEWNDRLFFGPCKKPMRPRMTPGDYVFGVSPSRCGTRRIVFAARIEERIAFAEAFERYPSLHGPPGPIHVRPVLRAAPFPLSAYEHIPDAMHANNWESDLATRNLDAFFVCDRADGWLGRWLGRQGPEIDDELLAFLRTCAVYGQVGRLSSANRGASKTRPVCHGGLCTGLHLETDNPEGLLDLCRVRLAGAPQPATTQPARQSRSRECERPSPERRRARGGCR